MNETRGIRNKFKLRQVKEKQQVWRKANEPSKKQYTMTTVVFDREILWYVDVFHEKTLVL